MSRLGDKIPVEPLSDDRYARIEDRVVAAFEGIVREPPARRPFTRALARSLRWTVPAVAVAAALLLVYLRSQRPDENPRPPAVATSPTRIVTDAAGKSRYLIGDAAIAFGKDTTADIERRTDGTVAVMLETGEVACEVEPRPARSPFIVQAGTVKVTVVGTAFKVKRSDIVHVEVTRGVVRVDTEFGRQLLRAGESWSGPAQLAANTSAAGSGTPVEGSESGPEGGDGRIGTGADRPDVAIDVDAPKDKLLHERTSKRPHSASRERDRKSEKSRRAGDKRAAQKRALRRAKPHRGGPPADNAELAAIMSLESKNPKEAVEKYRTIALTRGSAAEFALYSMAYTQYFKLRQRRAALDSLHHYRRRFPRGSHTESVLWLRIRILCEGSDRKSCRSAAHTYLGRFPNGHHADLAEQIIHWDM